MWRPETLYDAAGHLDEGVVHAWIDAALAPDAAAEVAQHAAACAACAARVAEARGFVAGASRLVSALDDGIVSAAPVAAAPVRTAPVTPITAARSRRWSTQRIAAVAAVAMIAAVGVVATRGGDDVAVTASSSPMTESAPVAARRDAADEELAITAAPEAPAAAADAAGRGAAPAARSSAGIGSATAAGADASSSAATTVAPSASPPSASPPAASPPAAALTVASAPVAAEAAAKQTPAPAPPPVAQGAAVSSGVLARGGREPAPSAASDVTARSQSRVALRGSSAAPAPAASVAGIAGCWRLSGGDVLRLDTVRVTPAAVNDSTAYRLGRIVASSAASSDLVWRIEPDGSTITVRSGPDVLRLRMSDEGLAGIRDARASEPAPSANAQRARAFTAVTTPVRAERSACP